MKKQTNLKPLKSQQLDKVSGAKSIPVPEKMNPINNPVYYTQALGEDGGPLPLPID